MNSNEKLKKRNAGIDILRGFSILTVILLHLNIQFGFSDTFLKEVLPKKLFCGSSILTKALITEFPKSYSYYSEKYFSYNGINQPNRNKLLFRDKTIDGVKTGHTEEAGYCLVSSSEKDGMRLVSVVMGTSSDNARAQETQKLLAYGFRYYHTHKLYEKNATVSTARVWKGKLDSIELGVTQDIYLTVPRGSEDNLVAKASVDNIIEAPVSINQELGSIIITLEGEELLNAPLVSLKAVEEAGLFSRIYDAVALFFYRFTAE